MDKKMIFGEILTIIVLMMPNSNFEKVFTSKR